MPHPLFDRSRLRIQPLARRTHDLDLSALLPLDAPLPAFAHEALPILGRRLVEARGAGAARLLLMGAHVLRAGVARHLIDLMERGLLTHIAMNGAGPIHDWEFALIGATTESVARYIQTGEFGLWEETGRMNEVVRRGARAGLGLGEALGREILDGDFPHKEISVLAAGVRLGVPVTVHVGIGYDILHEHPNCDGAAFGQTSYQDFLAFTQAVTGLEGGVLLNFGSAVMGPEVYLKALAMARNVAHQEGRQICHFTTGVFDLVPLDGDTRRQAPRTDPRYYYRPWKTILVRTVADGGESFYVQGDHRVTVPHLRQAVLQSEVPASENSGEQSPLMKCLGLHQGANARRSPELRSPAREMSMLTDTRIEQILARIPTLTVGVVGDLFLDRYLDIDATLTEPSIETGLDAYQVTRVRSYPGAAGTVINNLAALEVKRVCAVSVIGDDGEGYELRQALAALRVVDTARVISAPERRTPTYTKPMLHEIGRTPRELNRLDIKNRTPLAGPLQDLVREALAVFWPQLDALLVLDQVSEPECGVITTRVREGLAALGEVHAGKPILADSRERIGLFRSVWLKPNVAECRRAVDGPEDPDACAAALARRSGRPVFCTLGGDGMLVADPRTTPPRVAHVPGYPVQGPIDIVGAGDSTSAAIACAVAAGVSLEEAAAFGNLVASITIRQLGTTGTASPAQVRQRWREVAQPRDLERLAAGCSGETRGMLTRPVALAQVVRVRTGRVSMAHPTPAPPMGKTL